MREFFGTATRSNVGPRARTTGFCSLARDPSIKSFGLATELQFIGPTSGQTGGQFLLWLCAVHRIFDCSSSARMAINPAAATYGGITEWTFVCMS